MKPIPRFEGKYSIDETGRVWSHGRGIFLAPYQAKSGYVSVRLGESANRYIHRLIGVTYLGLGDGMVIDHKDGDKANNNVSNLRVCTKTQNQGNRRMGKNNTSGFKGVSWHKGDKRWRARLSTKDGEIFLGQFKTPEDAARAYDAVAVKQFGEFASLNFNAQKPA